MTLDGGGVEGVDGVVLDLLQQSRRGSNGFSTNGRENREDYHCSYTFQVHAHLKHQRYCYHLAGTIFPDLSASSTSQPQSSRHPVPLSPQAQTYNRKNAHRAG